MTENTNKAQALAGPFFLSVALLGLKGVPPWSYLTLYGLLLLPVASAWHLWVMPRLATAPWPRRGALVNQPDEQLLWLGLVPSQPFRPPRLAWEDLRSLGWYVLALLPHVGGYLAVLGVFLHRVRLREQLGQPRAWAVTEVLLFCLPALLALGLCQHLLLGGMVGFASLCEMQPRMCGLGG